MFIVDKFVTIGYFVAIGTTNACGPTRPKHHEETVMGKFLDYLIEAALWALVLAMAAVVVFVIVHYAQTDPPQLTEADAVVYVDKGEGHGSGAHIGNGLILTAAHVVDGAEKVTIRSADGTTSDTEVLWSANDYDIALMRFSDAEAIDKIPAAQLSCDTLNVGDEIRLIGNPLNMEFISGYGRIAGRTRPAGHVKLVYVTDITIVMGQSGGPLFHDGRIYAVASGIMTAPIKIPNGAGYVPTLTGYGYAVPSSVVCDLMGRTS